MKQDKGLNAIFNFGKKGNPGSTKVLFSDLTLLHEYRDILPHYTNNYTQLDTSKIHAKEKTDEEEKEFGVDGNDSAEEVLEEVYDSKINTTKKTYLRKTTRRVFALNQIRISLWMNLVTLR